MIGQKFSRWTVISQATTAHGFRWLCRCECGTEKIVRQDQLKRGISKSCGCWKSEVAKKQITELSTTHGLSNQSRTYGIWKDMRKRCNNENHKSYKYYGGRGIKVCPEWDSYETFLTDMGEAPDGLSIDRKNNEGNYEPNNCHWVDRKSQSNNMRSNIMFRYNGEVRTLKQWCDHFGVSYHTVWQRIFKLGWTFHKALNL